MKLFGRLAPDLIEVQAQEVRPDQRLAAGRYQDFGMSNVSRHGETVLEVDTTTTPDLVYIIGEREPGFSWTLAPTESVMIEREPQS